MKMEAKKGKTKLAKWDKKEVGKKLCYPQNTLHRKYSLPQLIIPYLA